MRPLFDWEIAAGRMVFGDSIAYQKVQIYEDVAWPNAVYRFGQWFHGLNEGNPAAMIALAVGYRCFFPTRLPSEGPPVSAAEETAVAWLVHELAHVWQYERVGWRYAVRALVLHIRLGPAAYQLDPPSVLCHKRAIGWGLGDMNVEQQGCLAAAYYLARRSALPSAGELLQAYEPFAAEFRGE